MPVIEGSLWAANLQNQPKNKTELNKQIAKFHLFNAGLSSKSLIKPITKKYPKLKLQQE